MKTVITIVGIALAVNLVLFQRSPFAPDPMARIAVSAVATGDFQFLGLLNADHTKTLPEVPGIPAWYFEHAGVKLLSVPPKATNLDMPRKIKIYNDALYRELKARGKLHIVEEDVARVRAELESGRQLQRTN